MDPAPTTTTRLPTFSCVGMERSGTTTLHQLLAQHPDIFLSIDYKEHFFFGGRWERGLDWYLSRFEGYEGQTHVGDLTPSYYRSPRSLRRLSETLGDDVRIIVSLRHPVRRAISHYCHDVQTRNTDGPFDAFVEPVSSWYFVDYVSAIRRIYDQFPPSSVLVLLFERDIESDLQSGLDTICDFLEIERFHPETRRANRSTFPQYLFGGDDGLDYVDAATGEQFHIPPRWLVYCSGKRKGRIVRRPTDELVAQSLARQEALTKSFAGPYIDELFDRLYDRQALYAALGEIGVDAEPWWSTPSDDIVLAPAPPPRRFSLDAPKAERPPRKREPSLGQKIKRKIAR